MFMADKANFEGIAKKVSPPLYTDKVFQKCFIDVNERGTEAAAVTCMYSIFILLFYNYNSLFLVMLTLFLFL